MRFPTQKQKPRRSKMHSFPAPTAGLIRNRNMATARDGGPGAAVLENWWPTATGAVTRRGYTLHRQVGDAPRTPVSSLFTYTDGVVNELFAADDDTIWNITTDTPDDVVTGNTSGRWNTVQFTTTGGTFLIGVNGEDDAFIYDGTTFDPLNVTGVDLDDLSYVWSYKNRLFFIEKGTLDVWYLAVDSISGALTRLPLGGEFSLGGNLLFGQSWSLGSGGEGGLSEQCVFVTDQGEVAVFQGTDPSSANAWSKVGVYRIGRPMGQRAFIRAGGDLVIATTIGFLSLAKSVQLDYAALAVSSISYPVESEWDAAVSERGAGEWIAEIWPEGQMILVAPHRPSAEAPLLLPVNATTGAWTVFTNWDVRSMAVFQGRLYFGTTDGRVMHAYVTGADNGQNFQCRYLPLFDDLGTPASRKVGKLGRAVIRGFSDVNITVAARFDFDAAFPSPPGQSPTGTGSEWETGIWDESVWSVNRPTFISQKWQSIGGSGYAVSLGAQVTSGAPVPLDAELVRLDLTYETGDIVT